VQNIETEFALKHLLHPTTLCQSASLWSLNPCVLKSRAMKAPLRILS
jgi:hypothetical protein